jgi:glycosyltransferase AglD
MDEVNMKELSIVIPIYNEEAILEMEVTRLIEEMKQSFADFSYEIFLVENGSFDKTKQIVEELEAKYTEVRSIHLPDASYGSALKHGLLQNDSKYTAIFNIDFWDVPFLKKAFSEIGKVDMVVGSKTAPGAEDTRPLARRVITKTFNWLLQKTFGFRGTDTHGIKLVKTEKLQPIIKQCQTEREIFDTEFVLRAEAAGLKTKELPVVCVERRKTVYRISQRIPRTIKDLVTFFFSFRLKQFSKLNIGLVTFSIFIFLFSALYGFPNSPSPWFDNGVNLGLAKTYVQDGVYSLRLGPGNYIPDRPLFISTNYPLIGWIILSFKLFGVGLMQAQIVMLLFVIGFLISAGILVSRWYGTKYVPWMMALVVTFLPFYGNGLSGGLGELPGLVYLIVALLLLEKQTSKHVFLCGICFGLAITTKVFFLVSLVALGIAELVRVIIEKKIFLKRWLLLAVGMLGPGIIWLRTLLPDGFSVSSIRQTFSYYSNPYDVAGVVSENILRFVTESTPLHFFILFIIYHLSLILKHKKNRLQYGEIFLSVFLVLNIIFYVRTVGWYRYLFPAHLLLLVLLAPSLVSVVKKIKSIAMYGGAVLVLVALVTIQTVHLLNNRNDRLYYNPIPKEFAAQIDKELGTGADILVIDKPELWFLLKNNNARQRMKMNPIISYGDDVFGGGQLPDYIVSGEPEKNEYIAANIVRFNLEYERLMDKGSYVLFGLK